MKKLLLIVILLLLTGCCQYIAIHDAERALGEGAGPCQVIIYLPYVFGGMLGHAEAYCYKPNVGWRWYRYGTDCESSEWSYDVKDARWFTLDEWKERINGSTD